MENGGAPPTGCYKCGRPGHWSRDCPSNPSSNPNDINPKTTSYAFKAGGGGAAAAASKAAVGEKSGEKPKKVPRSRPKLTPELLLSNDGIGYVLRHFPRVFKYHGRGHEVSDLGNLLGLYAEWHSHLIPYYSFNQFVHKVEEVGASKRVKVCLRDLREKVARGGDPTKLDEPPVQRDISNHEQEAMNLEEPSFFPEDTSMENRETDELLPEVMLHEIYEKATEEPSQTLQEEITAGNNTVSSQQVSDINNDNNNHNQNNSVSRESQMSEEQNARIEANRLKALERAAARARASLTATA